jgi:hypothetical protein
MSKNTLLSELINYISSNNSGNVVVAAPTSGLALDVTGDGRYTGVLTLGSTITNGTNTYTLPSATGTLALVGGSGVGTVTSVSALTLGTTGTDLSSSVANSTTTPVITLNVPTASATNRGALSSSDWTTFNSKQSAGNYIDSLTGEATASGPGAAAVTLNNASVTGKVLTGVNITGGTVLATDTMLTAFGKLQNQINGLVGSTIYQGVWNATTNTPTLTSSVGTNGYYYIVNVAGSTNLNGITDWKIGDWVIFNGGVWQKVDNTDSVTSVNGQVGAVSLTTDNISQGTTNIYFTNALARTAISLTTTGSSGSATYNNTTGIFNIPNYGSALSGYLPLTGGTLTGGLIINPANTATIGLDVASNTVTLRSDSTNPFPRQLTTTMGSGALVKMQAAGYGAAYVTDLGFYTSTSSAVNTTPNLYMTGGNNRVGINTATPAYVLDVVGTVGVSGQLTLGSTITNGTYTYTLPGATGTLALVGGSGVGTVTSVAALTIGTTGTDLSSSVANSTTTPVITLNVPTASSTNRGALSAADWTTFNSKQAALSGTGFVKISGTTISYDNSTYYLASNPSGFITSSALASYLPLSGGTLSGALSGTSATFSGGINLTGTANSFQVASIFRNANRVFFGGDTGGYFFQNSGNTATVLQIADTGAATFSSSVTTNGGILDNAGYLQAYSTTNSYLVLKSTYASTGKEFQIASKTDGNLTFYDATVGSERMRITSAGNVGIGTTAPSQKLTIVGSGTLSTLAIGTDTTHQLLIGADSSYAEIQAITQGVGFNKNLILQRQGGNVGIGTTSPIDKFHVVGGFTSTSLSVPSNTTVGSLQVGYDGTSGIIRTYASSPITLSSYNYQSFETLGSERMRITSGGNVGIGTTAPNLTSANRTTVDINGTNQSLLAFSNAGTFKGYIYNGGTDMDYSAVNQALFGAGTNVIINTGGSERMRITSGGNVLIGTTTDSGQKLQVLGNAAFNGFGINTSSLTSTGANQNFVQFRNTGGDFYIGQEGSTAGGFFTASSAYASIFYGVTAQEFIILGVRRLQIATSGAATFSSSVSATSFFETSDKTVKTLISDNALIKGIEKVTAKTYLKNNKEEIGYFAQDLQGILDSSINVGENGLLSLSYTQVHTAKIAVAESEIDKLKRRVAELEQQLN